MSLLISTRTELIKTKRSAAFWLSLIGSMIIPLILFLMYTLRSNKKFEQYQEDGWHRHFMEGWQVFTIFLLPMFVILICSLIPQIEYKNNTWKQVFASPQKISSIFFSKYLAIIIMVLFLFLAFNLFLILSAVVPNLMYEKYGFLDHAIGWMDLFRINVKTFVSLLAIIAIQYWFGLRFRNFIVPMALGLGLLIVALTLIGTWEHVDKVPYAFPAQSLFSEGKGDPLAGPFLKNHEWNSIGYFIFFTLLAFWDMKFRKERG